MKNTAALFAGLAGVVLIRFRRIFVAAAFFMAAGLIGFAALPAARAENGANPGEIKAAIKEAKSKAEEGKAGLTKLTARERELNAGLASAEDRISALEKKLTAQEAQLEILETAHQENTRA